MHALFRESPSGVVFTFSFPFLRERELGDYCSTFSQSSALVVTIIIMYLGRCYNVYISSTCVRSIYGSITFSHQICKLNYIVCYRQTHISTLIFLCFKSWWPDQSGPITQHYLGMLEDMEDSQNIWTDHLNRFSLLYGEKGDSGGNHCSHMGLGKVY